MSLTWSYRALPPGVREEAQARARIIRDTMDVIRQDIMPARSPMDIDEWVEKRSHLVIAALANAQTKNATLIDKTMNMALMANGWQDTPIGLLAPEAFAGQLPNGAGLELIPNAVARRVREDLALGKSPYVAWRNGNKLLSKIVLTSLIDTQRAARAIAGLARPRTMYMRMATIPCCARCAVLAGKKGFWEKPFQRHPMCDCDQIPIPMDQDVEFTGPEFSAAEYFESLTEKEQDRIFTIAGAQAIREGADIAQVVNSRQGMTGATKGFTRVRSQWMRKESKRRMSVDAIMGVKDPVTRWEMLKEQGYVRSVSGRGHVAETGRGKSKLGLQVSTKGSKRTIRHAAEGANPTGDVKNCVRCVNAWLMRLLGMNVHAIPGQPGMTAEQSTKTWRKNNKPPVWISSDHPEGAYRWKRVKEEIDDLPVGSLGLVRYKVGRSAHVIGWMIDNEGRIKLIDPQNVHNDVESELIRSIPGSIRWVNMKGFSPTEATRIIVMGE